MHIEIRTHTYRLGTERRNDRTNGKNNTQRKSEKKKTKTAADTYCTFSAAAAAVVVVCLIMLQIYRYTPIDHASQKCSLRTLTLHIHFCSCFILIFIPFYIFTWREWERERKKTIFFLSCHVENIIYSVFLSLHSIYSFHCIFGIHRHTCALVFVTRTMWMGCACVGNRVILCALNFGPMWFVQYFVYFFILLLYNYYY